MRLNRLLPLAFAMVGLCSASAGTVVKTWTFDEAGPSGRPEGWRPLEQGPMADQELNRMVLSSESRSGRGAAMITLDTLYSGFSPCFVDEIKPQTWYRLSLWVKSRLHMCLRGPSVFVARLNNEEFPIGNKDKIYGMALQEQATEAWQPLELVFCTPDHTTNSYVALAAYQSRGHVWFDDMQLEELSTAEAEQYQQAQQPERVGKAKSRTRIILPGLEQESKLADEVAGTEVRPGQNLLMNGSFEVVTAPDMPDCWCHHCRYASFDPDFRENYRAVSEGAFHGTNCFRLKGRSLHYGIRGWLKDNERPGVLRLYLRTDEPGSKITVACNRARETFEPTTDWQPYVMAVPEVKRNMVSLETEGFVTIDAVKLELGETPTPFSPHAYEFLNPMPLIEKADPPTASLSPTHRMLGDLRGRKGLVINGFHTEGGGTPGKATEAALLLADDALQVRFQCHGRAAGDLVCASKTRDDFVPADDAVCVILNPGLRYGREPTFLFAVNSRGVSYDAAGTDPGWNTDWSAEAEAGEDGYTVRMSIPLAALGNGNFIGETWKINLVRYSAARADEPRELSAWFYPAHEIVEQTGVLVDGFDGLDKYRLCVAEPRVLFSGVPTAYFKTAYAVQCRVSASGPLPANTLVRLVWPSGRSLTRRTRDTGNVVRVTFPGLLPDDIRSLRNYRVDVIQESTRVASSLFGQRLDLPPMLEAGPLDRNIYTSEQEAEVMVRSNLTRDLADSLELNISVFGPSGRITRHVEPARSGRHAFDISGLGPGVYTVQVALRDAAGGAQTYAEDEVSLEKLPPNDYEVKFDPISRMAVVDGKPFFILATEMPHGIQERHREHVAHYRRDIPELAKRFTTIMWHVNTIPENVDFTGYPPEYHDYALHREFVGEFARAGLKTILWLPMTMLTGEKQARKSLYHLDSEGILDYTLKALAFFKDEPDIIGWFTMDEIYGWWRRFNEHNRESEVLDHYWAVKKVDPYRLYVVNSNYGGGRVYGGWESADSIGGSFYRILGYPPLPGVAGVRGYVKKQERERRRHGAHKITRGYIPSWPRHFQRHASLAEHRAEVYQMVIHGCREVDFFTYKPMSMALWDQFVDYKNELAFLTPVLATQPVTHLVQGSNPRVDFAVFAFGGKHYLLASNHTLKPVVCAFDLTALGAVHKAGVLFEKRDVKLERGVLRDGFARHATHVYEIE